MNKKLKVLQNKKIAILGLGLENYALVKYLLKKKINCEITICDARVGAMHASPQRRYNVHWQLGKNFDKGLDKFDILFRSPGWPIFCPGIVETRRVSPTPILSSPIKFFFELCPTKNIIGVTGTKGKGTTASLIYEILKNHFKLVETHSNASLRSGPRVWLGGNIGVAPFEFLAKIKKSDWVILELSSFQLEDFKISPKLAVITNFYPEHLAAADPNNPNYHRRLKDYWQAKLNIVKWQKKGNWAIINKKFLPKADPRLADQLHQSDSEASRRALLAEKIKSKIIYFTKSNLPSKLVGEHNQENIAAAVAVAKVIGIKAEIIEKAVAGFKGLEHRLELVRTIKGVKYYNDSFATTPESTITALRAFSQPVILFLGGAEKKSDFNKLVKEVKRRVKFVILLAGQATPRLKSQLIRSGFNSKKMNLVYNIKQAVRQAKEVASSDDIVLLSPACASFGMFKNYKERGKLFKKEVNQLK